MLDRNYLCSRTRFSDATGNSWARTSLSAGYYAPTAENGPWTSLFAIRTSRLLRGGVLRDEREPGGTRMSMHSIQRGASSSV